MSEPDLSSLFRDFAATENLDRYGLLVEVLDVRQDLAEQPGQDSWHRCQEIAREAERAPLVPRAEYRQRLLRLTALCLAALEAVDQERREP